MPGRRTVKKPVKKGGTQKRRVPKKGVKVRTEIREGKTCTVFRDSSGKIIRVIPKPKEVNVDVLGQNLNFRFRKGKVNAR